MSVAESRTEKGRYLLLLTWLVGFTAQNTPTPRYGYRYSRVFRSNYSACTADIITSKWYLSHDDLFPVTRSDSQIWSSTRHSDTNNMPRAVSWAMTYRASDPSFETPSSCLGEGS
jgi:hypothetical protein